MRGKRPLRRSSAECRYGERARAPYGFHLVVLRRGRGRYPGPGATQVPEPCAVRVTWLEARAIRRRPARAVRPATGRMAHQEYESDDAPPSATSGPPPRDVMRRRIHLHQTAKAAGECAGDGGTLIQRNTTHRFLHYCFSTCQAFDTSSGFGCLPDTASVRNVGKATQIRTERSTPANPMPREQPKTNATASPSAPTACRTPLFERRRRALPVTVDAEYLGVDGTSSTQGRCCGSPAAARPPVFAFVMVPRRSRRRAPGGEIGCTVLLSLPA